MTLKEKFKQWIRLWLFKEEIERFNDEADKMKQFQAQFSQAHMNLSLATSKMQDATDTIEETRKLIGAICEVGTDIDMHSTRNHNNSWAVICVHGKMDYVKFVHMNQSDIRSIVGFLKNFEYSNRIIDTPMKCAIENTLLNW